MFCLLLSADNYYVRKIHQISICINIYCILYVFSFVAETTKHNNFCLFRYLRRGVSVRGSAWDSGWWLRSLPEVPLCLWMAWDVMEWKRILDKLGWVPREETVHTVPEPGPQDCTELPVWWVTLWMLWKSAPVSCFCLDFSLHFMPTLHSWRKVQMASLLRPS